MTGRLWVKLVALSVGVALGAVLLISIAGDLTLTRGFLSYVEETQELRNRQLAAGLADALSREGTWTAALRAEALHLSAINSVIIRVEDVSGRTVLRADGSSMSGMMEEMMEGMMGRPPDQGPAPRGETKAYPLVVGDSRAGTVFITSTGTEGFLTPRDVAFRSFFNRTLWLAALTSGALALLLGVWFSRRLTRPLQEMTRAARGMEAGELSERASVDSRDEMGELAAALNHLASSLERQESLRRQLLSDLAHEIRTPLATIRSHLEAFQDGLLAATPENVESVKEEVLRLNRLVEDLRQLYQAESGELEIAAEPVDLGDLVGRLKKAMAPRFEEKGVSLVAEVEGRLSVRGDEDRLNQALSNLVTNALKFTPEGGSVLISAAAQGREAVVAVTDNGPGIGPDDLPHVFERFYRGEKSRSRATGGAGIGLTIAKELVEAHGGRIEVESRSGRGAVFTVRLPLAA